MERLDQKKNVIFVSYISSYRLSKILINDINDEITES